METASQAELDLINISIDDETEERGEDWTSKLGLNLRHCVNIRKQSPSKKEWHALALGGLFSDQVCGLNISTLKWQSRKPRMHHKGTGRGHSNSQDHLYIKKIEDETVSHSGGNVFAKNQVLGSISKPCTIVQACRSRGRGRPRKHTPKESVSGNESITNDNGDPENKTIENASGEPPHSNERVENNLSQVVNSSAFAGPSPKSSEAQEEILTTHETNMMDETCNSISHTVDIPMGEVPENQQPIQTPDRTSLASEVCHRERSPVLPDIAISGVLATGETKEAAKVLDDSSVSLLTVDTPGVESFKMQQEIQNVEETTMAEKNCDFATICTVDSSATQEEIYATKGTPIVTEICDSAKLPPLPALTGSASKSPRMQRETQNVEDTAMTDASCDIETSADIATVIISVAKHPDMESEIRTNDDDDRYSSMEPAHLPTIPVSEAESSMMMLDIQTTEDCSPTGGVCDSSKPAGHSSMSVSVVGNSEMRHDAQTTDKTNTLGEVCSSTGGMEKANVNPILVYSRVRKGQRKRKGVVSEKTGARESCIGFIRSPCEGLRPRSGRKAAGEMEANSAVEECEPRKKAKMAPGSLGGGRDKEKHKLCYTCDLDGCRMSFMTKAELQLHKRNRCTHEGCGKRFSSHKYAIHHERVHNDDRPLKCSWEGCNMSFKWPWARTEHLRVHTGERPYQCKVTGCGLTFRFVSDFSRHRRRTGHYVN